MSLSKPFFNNQSVPKAQSFQPVDEAEFLKLHWTKQLQLRPLLTRKRWNNDANIDFDNLIDNWDTDPDREEIT